MITNELLNKGPDIVTEEAPLIILDRKYDVFMSNIGKDTNHTRHIARRIHFVRNFENLKIHKIDWCKGGLQLEDIASKNFGDNDLYPRMKYFMVSLDN